MSRLTEETHSLGGAKRAITGLFSNMNLENNDVQKKMEDIINIYMVSMINETIQELNTYKFYDTGR